MNTIGLIGGLSWESTAIYYRLLNEGVRDRVGGLASASLVLASLDFAPIAQAMGEGRWDSVEATLTRAARQLEAAGAGCIALCSNTMHKLAPQVAAATALPFADVRDAAGRALQRQGAKRPLLLATKYTMEQGFWRDHVAQAFGLDVAVPPPAAREALQRIIFDELCRGVIRPESKAVVLSMLAEAARDGCDALIFGCTEIVLLLDQADTALPVFDTTALHCAALLEVALPSSQPASQAP